MGSSGQVELEVPTAQAHVSQMPPHSTAGPLELNMLRTEVIFPPCFQKPVSVGGALMSSAHPSPKPGEALSIIFDSSLSPNSHPCCDLLPLPITRRTSQDQNHNAFNCFANCRGFYWLGTVSRQVKVFEIHTSHDLMRIFEIFMAHFLSDLTWSPLLPYSWAAEKLLQWGG